VPLIVIIPLLTLNEASILPAVGIAVVKAVLALGIIMFLGRLLLRPFFRLIVRHQNHELFTALILLVVMGVAALTFHFGLSMALGAFLAGVILSETEFRHQIAADIEPFRGLLLGLFFMTVGMMLDRHYLVEQPLLIFEILAGIFAIKYVIFYAFARIYDLPHPKAAKTAILLSQGGEFAFVLIGLAIYHHVVPEDFARLLYIAITLSMVLTPILVQLFWPKLSAEIAEGGSEIKVEDFEERRNHILVFGFGRVGEIIALMLEEQKIPYIVIDDHHDRVTRARARGLPVFYGDATRPHMLRAAGAEAAKAAVVAVSSTKQANSIVRMLRNNYEQLPVFCRARDSEHARELREAGVTATVPITLYASLELGGTLLKSLGTSQNKIDSMIHQIRATEEAFS
jgi:CPA2 family monovalent cation:H+ antiporter-2